MQGVIPGFPFVVGDNGKVDRDALRKVHGKIPGRLWACLYAVESISHSYGEVVADLMEMPEDCYKEFVDTVCGLHRTSFCVQKPADGSVDKLREKLERMQKECGCVVEGDYVVPQLASMGQGPFICIRLTKAA